MRDKEGHEIVREGERKRELDREGGRRRWSQR